MALLRDLGPYHIVRRLGKGGMGEVYVAEDTRLPSDSPNYRVALKVMWKDSDAESAGIVEAERQGAILQSRLYGIDNRIARVNGFGDIDDTFYLDMELIDGRDLAELMAQGPMEPGESLRVALEVADILARLHSMPFLHQGKETLGVIHGDIKPRNIRLESSGRVRLLDFGIAKALSKTRKLTRNEFGSITYASPERLDSGDVNEQSDLWSLSVVLYEMLAGKAPFDAENTRKIEQRILSGAPSVPLPSSTPAIVDALLKRALARNPVERFPSASHFKIALKEARRALIIGKEGSGPLPRPESGYSNAATQVVEPISRPITPLKPEEIAATQRVATVPRPSEATMRTSAGADEDPSEQTRRTRTDERRSPARGASFDASGETDRLEQPVTQRTSQSGSHGGEDTARSFAFPDKGSDKSGSAESAGDKKKGDGFFQNLFSPRPSTPSGIASPDVRSAELGSKSDKAPFPLKVEEAQSLVQASGTQPGQSTDLAASKSEPKLPVQADAAVEKVFPPPWLSKLAIGVAAVGFVVAIAKKSDVEHRSQGLVEQIQSRNLGCNEAWDSYVHLRDASIFKPDLKSLHGALVPLCETEVDQVIKRYRDDNPNLNKSDWKRADESARHLMVLVPSEDRYRAWELYTNGQVARIEDRYDEALSMFAKAIEIQPQFCDPHYAELHVYAYSARKDLGRFLSAALSSKEANCELLPKHQIWKADISYEAAEEQFKALDSTQPNYLVSLRSVRELYVAAREVYAANLKVGNARKKKVSCDRRIKDLDARMSPLEYILQDPSTLFGQHP